jgi:two-component system OmpR family response regulator
VRALVVEDGPKMAALLRRGLAEEGYAADVARTGEDAVRMARSTPYDAIVLDVMLPGLDGFGVCRELRASGVWTPILMLTARDGVEDRVAGLDAGAADYLIKPFSFAELLARLRARPPGPWPSAPPCSRPAPSAWIRPPSRCGGARWPSSCRPREFALLETFMRRPGQVLSRLDLLDHAWDAAYENRSNVVDVYVGYLRASSTGRSSGTRSRRCGGPATVKGTETRMRPVTCWFVWGDSSVR